MKKRLFSLPYNGYDSNEYLNMITPYKQHIENIYFSLPELDSFIPYENLQGNNVYSFLKNSQGLYKRILACNKLFYDKNNNIFLRSFEKNIYPILDEYKIDGVILTNLELAIKLHKDFPKLELHTSCNCYQWTLKQMEYWRKVAGIEIFNPPREAAKTPSMIKTMHEAGFKLKVIVNQACLYGCGYMMNHACIGSNYHCGHGDVSNIFRTNAVLPQWLKYIDEYVDIYKLAGRVHTLESLKTIFDAYILQTPYKNVYDILNFYENNYFSLFKKLGIDITYNDIPEKTRYCEMKGCNKDCFVCDKAIENLLIKNEHKLQTLLNNN